MVEETEKLLNGAQAAEFLGVKSATLYAYASRGLIESMPSEKARERCYRLADLIKLRQASRGFKNPKDAEQAVWTGPVIKSSITELRNEGHFYRGQSALRLASDNVPFGSVAELLWGTEDGADTSWKKTKALGIPKAVRNAATGDADYLDLFKLLLACVELTDPISRQLLSDDIFDTARRLIVTLAITPGLANDRAKYIADAPNPIAQTLTFAFTGSKSKERANMINRALVLCADHELNASTLAARIAASCDASLYSCLLSALGTFSGSLHGSASRRTEDMISNSLRFKSTKSWLKDFMRQQPRIPGFGTDLYSEGDPRAKLLIDNARQIAGKNSSLERLLEIVECVQEALGLEPNLDVGLAAISYALALPPGASSTIFAISRTTGWIAHAIEQRMYGGVIRPRARYIGK